MTNIIKSSSKSYLDFFLNNYKSEPVQDKTPTVCRASTAIQGTCTSMCPDEEVTLRKKERMVHVLEVVGNKQWLVKRYSRPAADTNLAVPHNLRPFPVLKKTIYYLLFEVTKRTDVSTLVIYNFVTDRLRAVRQDMIIQELPPELRVVLLEPMIRFHIYYGYLLCELPVKDYSPTLNRNFLLECLKTCLSSHDELELKDSESNNISFLIKNMDKCCLEEKDEEPQRNRSLIEALYVLTTLYEESPMWRLWRLSDSIRHAPLVRLAYRLSVAALSGHYVTVTKYMKELCPLAFCAVALFLPMLQRRTLQVLSVAYSSGGRPVPLRAVCGWLAAGEGAARDMLRHYGVQENDGMVVCRRGSFRDDAPLLPPRKITAEHLEGKMNIDYIFTYTPYDT